MFNTNNNSSAKSVENNKFEFATRIFYTISYILTTAAFLFYVYQSYVKWRIEPDIAVRRHSRYLEEIPFPALTVCSPVFASSNVINYDQYSIRRTTMFPEILKNVSSHDANYFLACQQACDPYNIEVAKEMKKFRTETDIVKLLNESFLGIDEVFVRCLYGSMATKCDGMFNRVLTDRGFCYTFNLQGFNTIFNADVISDDFQSYNRTNKVHKTPRYNYANFGYLNDDNETIEWTLDGGYSMKYQDHFVPVKAMKAYSISFYLWFDKSNEMNLCKFVPNSFDYVMHLPNEIPTPLHRKYFVRFHEQSYVTLKATIFKTSENLRELNPNARGCYFEGERQLKFFKSYTKSNCDFECMTNFTLKYIGCVKFSMPRVKNTPVCDMDKSQYCYKLMEIWPGFNKTTKEVISDCNCLKTCSDIKYEILWDVTTSTKQDDNSTLRPPGVPKEATFSRLAFNFEENFVLEEESYAPYTLQNFIADTGGLLGLFIGCSILSIFEIFYFLTIKMINVCMKDDKLNIKIDKQENVMEVIPVQDSLKNINFYTVQDFEKLKNDLQELDKKFADFLKQFNIQQH